MKITAVPKSKNFVQIVPAKAQSIELSIEQAVAATYGWNLLCPYSFDAIWNGGSNPEDIEISAPGFVTSRDGHGVLTFDSGIELDLSPGHHLWLRGPANQFKPGLQALEQVIETNFLPFYCTINWQFTTPGQQISFKIGEPFATLIPYPVHYIEKFAGEIRSADDIAITPTQEQIRNYPPVSCICLTYARPHLVEEAIFSFLQQDYPGIKELIVLNDYEHQILEYSHPEVRVINLPNRCRSLGEKYNMAVSLASYDIIFVWDDDDISLPHRLTYSMDHYQASRGFFKAGHMFSWNNGEITGLEPNPFHGGSCWSRNLFDQVQGYPHIGARRDQAFEARIAGVSYEAIEPHPVKPEDVYLLYRWAGTQSYHVSALNQGDENPNAGYITVAEKVAEQVSGGEIPVGRIYLNPRWHTNYTQLARRCVAALNVFSPADDVKLADHPALVEPIAFAAHIEPRPERTNFFNGNCPLKLSVILPARNESLFLKRTVEQFLAQMPKGSEIIIVDNGSSDGSTDFLFEPGPFEACRILPGSEPPPPEGIGLRLLQVQEPLGVSGGRNAGFDHARGEIVVFSDAHVDVPPNWWQPIAETLKNPAVGVVGPAIGVLGKPDLPGSCGQRVLDWELRTRWLARVRREPYPVPTLGGGFMAMRHDALQESGAFDPGMIEWGAEDFELCLRYWLLGYEVWVVPEVEVPHYFRTKAPYQVEYLSVIHNTLRMAYLHLSQERIARVIWEMSKYGQYHRALALCVDSDVWQRRKELVARRVHDDDWFFEKFAEVNGIS